MYYIVSSGRGQSRRDAKANQKHRSDSRQTYSTRAILSNWSYRIPFLLQIAPGILLAGLLFILPFSPRWLAGKSRDWECLQVLVRLRGIPATDPRVQAEWLSIRTEAIHSREAFSERHPDLQGGGFEMDLKRELVGWIEMFSPAVLKRTQVGVGVMFFQQFVGINALIYYRSVRRALPSRRQITSDQAFCFPLVPPCSKRSDWITKCD
jgi:MFS family permease